ncbi:glycoside hydrolase [Auricularia subglabra TFB-10046 SS5]|nr:glycoside hydrolase [Auricularia subglabra TFB-10046 SS5]
MLSRSLGVVSAAVAVVRGAGPGFTGKPVVSGYWPSYASNLLPPEQIQYNQFTHIDWFVAGTTPTYELDFGGAEDLIKPVIDRAHKANVTVSLSVGGWTGSIYFSDLVANASSRAQYAQSIAGVLDKYGFDGVDIDWEYPAIQGLGCNTIRPDDADSFLGFLKDIRAYAPNTRISSAVSVSGIFGPGGDIYERINRLAVYLDYITIMAYDIYGFGWSQTTGPVGQLYDTCATDEGSGVSGALGVKVFTEHGFPAEKILLGMPAYAYPYITESSTLVPRTVGNATSLAYQNRTQDVPKGGVTSAGPGTDPCGVKTGPAPNWLFRELIETGRLGANGTVGGKGFKRHFDECTQTPFLFNPKTRDFIAYDDPQSYAAKAEWARKNGLAGINMFDLTGDTKDSKLIRAARSQLIGKKPINPIGLEIGVDVGVHVGGGLH